MSSMRADGKAYWRSLEELADTPQFREFLHHEFPAGATEMLDSDDRRHFLKIMGASMALAGAGLSGCRRWPREHIVPYGQRPEDRTPGATVQYATSMEIAGVAAGLLVTSYDGRPIKVEGNPEHPINRGRTDAQAQASVLDVYDPDRSRFPRSGGERGDRGPQSRSTAIGVPSKRNASRLGTPARFGDFTAWLEERVEPLRGRRGRGLAILSEATSSPSVRALRHRLREQMPDARWHEYEPLNNDNEHDGSVLAFGSPHRAMHHFDQARVIVSLDADFLMAHPAAVKHTWDFAQSRRAMDRDRTMSRLYAYETGSTVTGANADVRVTMRSGEIAVIAARLAAHVSPDAAPALREVTEHAVETPHLEQLIADLERHRGSSIVIAGPNQPAEVHLLAAIINDGLGNVGRTVTYTEQPQEVAHVQSLRELAEAMDRGEVETLLILGGNPAYNAPADIDFGAKIQRLQDAGGAAVHLSEHLDETSQLCHWHVNRAHYLEAWGDGLAWDGTLCITQPLIEPLFAGRSAIEVLAALLGDDLREGYDIVRRTFSELTGERDVDDPRSRWRRAVHDGLLEGSAAETVRPAAQRDGLADAARVISARNAELSTQNSAVELVFTRDYKVLDGRFANNGWLQELPEPMTRLTWDNALIIGVRRAKDMGVKTGDMVRVEVQGTVSETGGAAPQAGERSLELAALVLPGHPHETAVLPLGYGRRFEGRISAEAGFDAYSLRTTGAMGYAAATIEKVRGRYDLALTQDHYPIEDFPSGTGAQQRLPSLFREATLDEYREKGDRPFRYPPGLHVLHRLSLWEENMPFHSAGGFKGAPYAWAMAIDLSACTGCNACVVACQAENNIPIVGKQQVIVGREMHWLRVDRYFKGGTDERPEAVGFMPVLCMHCENAPCEEVCPVAATVHDKEGLNVMIYNRCIGTRYCSNNCPYKVRRFNYFDFHRRRPARDTGPIVVDRGYFEKRQAEADPLRQMQWNPEVTIRTRGVMEKCTYCIQRVAQAKIDARKQWRQRPESQRPGLDEQRPGRVPVPDESFTTACAQACPADAIVFGDLLDEDSRVKRLHEHERAYQMLEELNTKPRTRYLGKLRNPPT